jgi:hypothetical protein
MTDWSAALADAFTAFEEIRGSSGSNGSAARKASRVSRLAGAPRRTTRPGISVPAVLPQSGGTTGTASGGASVPGDSFAQSAESLDSGTSGTAGTIGTVQIDDRTSFAEVAGPEANIDYEERAGNVEY